MLPNSYYIAGAAYRTARKSATKIETKIAKEIEYNGIKINGHNFVKNERGYSGCVNCNFAENEVSRNMRCEELQRQNSSLSKR